MADDLPPPAALPPPTAEPPVSAALVVYALYALTAGVSLLSAGFHIVPLLSLVGVIGLVIAYVKRADARGTWVASHLSYLIRTFWWAMLFGIVCWVLGWILAVTIIGIPLALLLWIATPLWIIYRIIRGYLWFKDSRPVPV
ncbi:MAG TPA: hypothetical protein VIL19_00895 [Casimicrobiaceae bacterium]